MNQKELSEIRRRWKSDRAAVGNVYGCYVNSNKEIISSFDSSLGLLSHDETEMYLSILKKTLSGTLGKNLIDIEFETKQVTDGAEHALLMKLKKELLRDEDARNTLYRRILNALSFEDECSYLILLAADAYDVPHGKHAEHDDFDSAEVFKYFLCCICPVKSASLELGYVPDSGDFHSCSTGQTVAPPELGFMFPTFDGRATNIYNALYYTRRPQELHAELIDALFKIRPPMSAPEQKNAFGSVISGALDRDCSFDIVQSVNEQIRNRIIEHKESKEKERLELTVNDVERILIDCGVNGEKAESFREECEKSFGERAALDPNNIIDAKKMQILTPEIKISLSPENAYLIETRIIDGRKFLLIPADSGVEINGISVNVTEASPSVTAIPLSHG